jgi:hypothetical protein
MTPERMKFLMEAGFRRRRQNGEPAHIEHCARFLHVSPLTVRRWLRGERPIPRPIEIIMEGFHAWPEVFNPQAVDKFDRGARSVDQYLSSQKQH